MGYYLNSPQMLSLYESEAASPYFVDKTEIISELIPLVKAGNKHICITRPRRFGKSVMAAMVGAFFSRGADSSFLFDSLKVADDPDYQKYLNQYNVIYINFSEAANLSKSYSDFIMRIEKPLSRDLRREFPDVEFWEDASPIEDLRLIYAETQMKFIFVLDEWDCIFYKEFITKLDRERYINFLAALTKDKGYISLSYMTGVLPIAKYSSGSTINHFDEYTMSVQPKYSKYFGFTNREVDMLYERYLKIEKAPVITRDELEYWYDGYHTAGGEQLYNPRSVVKALSNNCLASYWTTTGPYSELSNYIAGDVDGVKKDVALMVSGEAVTSNLEEFAVTAMDLRTKDEIFSAMVVYGFLNYVDGKVRIPNKELMDEFAKTIRNEKKMGYIYELANVSNRMLQATLEGDTKTMEEILQFAHDTESPLLSYHNEVELTAIVNLVYLSARDRYYVEREQKSGRGYVDFIFYPERNGDDGIILELKVDDTPEAAIAQIKERNYILGFQGKMAQRKKCTGRILLVGIGYSKKTKDHHCKVEVAE